MNFWVKVACSSVSVNITDTKQKILEILWHLYWHAFITDLISPKVKILYNDNKNVTKYSRNALKQLSLK